METKKSRKWIWITLVIVAVLAAAALLIWHFTAAGKEAEPTGETASVAETETETEAEETTAAPETEESSVVAVTNSVVDTDAPKLEVRDVNRFCGEALAPEDFIVSCEDSSEYTLKFENEPDTSVAGTQEVTVIAEDVHGNRTACTANLTVIEDTTAPEIIGAENITISVGSDFDPMEGISVRDDMDPDPQLVATTNVNTEKPGEYTVRYKVTDASGNRDVEVIKVNVVE